MKTYQTLFLAITAFVIAPVAHAQQTDDDSFVPDHIRKQIYASPEVAGLEMVKPQDGYSSNKTVARARFRSEKPGQIACPDHYPNSLWRSDLSSCPDIRKSDPAAQGWINCHALFYAPQSTGCPPVPQEPSVPATIPTPTCITGAGTCSDEVVGAPVILRILDTPQLIKKNPTPTVNKPKHSLRFRTGLNLPQANSSTASSTQATKAAIAAIAASPELMKSLEATRLPLQALTMQACVNGNCPSEPDGEQNGNVFLPTPQIAPKGHVQCQYEHISFFVPQTRYCPKADNADRPPAGISLFASWEENDPSEFEFYYHYSDHDGLIRWLKRIMGSTDDRYSFLDATSREQLAAASTAMLVSDDRISVQDNSTVVLSNNTNWTPLCGEERFYGLPQPGMCSAVKIGPRLVATSAHCVPHQNRCNNTAVVFGYHGGNSATDNRIVPSEDVYQCKEIVGTRRPDTFEQRGADWTVFSVDRDIQAPTAQLSGAADVHTSLVTTVIGHPMGLPSVVTRFGVVQTTTSDYFVASSDTFAGNSGSAVFSAQSIEDQNPMVVGLLTGGKYDFQTNVENGKECVTALWCSDPDCLGDDVIYTDELSALLSGR